jgi:hypothetical protein
MTDRVLQALTALARARRANFEDADQRVYLRVLQNAPEGAVIQACGQLAGEPRKEFESAMPTAGDIKARAFTINRQQLNVAASQKLLSAPEFADDNPPVEPERVKNFKADVQAALRRHSMR